MYQPREIVQVEMIVKRLDTTTRFHQEVKPCLAQTHINIEIGNHIHEHLLVEQKELQS